MRIVILAFALAFSQGALATIITISADDYTRNSVITATGVTFGTWTQVGDGPVIDGPAVIAVGCDAVEAISCVPGVQSFGATVGSTNRYAPWFDPHHAIPCSLGGSCNWDGFLTLNAAFDAATDFVSVSGVWGNDPLGIWALDSTGALLSSCIVEIDACGVTTFDPGTPFYLSFGTVTISRPTADIAMILIGGYGAAGATAHSISYNQIPEPASVALLLSGLLGLALTKRRRSV